MVQILLFIFHLDTRSYHGNLLRSRNRSMLCAVPFLPSPTSTTTTSTLAESCQPLHPSLLASPLLPPFPYQSAQPSSFTSYSPQFCCSALSYSTLPRRPPGAPQVAWSPRDGGPYDGREGGGSGSG